MSKRQQITAAVLMAFMPLGACDSPPQGSMSRLPSEPPGATSHLLQSSLRTFSASPETQARTGIAIWQLGFENETAAADGLAAGGEVVLALRVTGSKTGVTISANNSTLELNARGEIVRNEISNETRILLERLAADAQGLIQPVGFLACAASMGGVIATSAACGATFGAACFGIPLGFCAASKWCGSNTCEM